MFTVVHVTAVILLLRVTRVSDAKQKQPVAVKKGAAK